MWNAKDKFGVIVRAKMNVLEFQKFISKNKGYSFVDLDLKRKKEKKAFIFIAILILIIIIL